MDPRTEQFEIEERWSDGAVTLTLRGDLDLEASRNLDDALERARSSGATGITLDLRQLTLLDSSGIRSLMVASLAAEGGVPLRLIRARPDLQRRFTLTDLESRLPFVADA